MDVTSGLNPAQRAAVLHEEGPLLVLAGAGSGKTRVLTRRIAYLIWERGVLPHQILAITFTNKAAREMKERVEQLIGLSYSELWISTFHSACARILRRQEEFFGRGRGFVIYDAGDQQALIKECVRELSLNEEACPVRSCAWAISQAKNRLIGPLDFEAAAQSRFEQAVSKVYRLYEDKLVRNNAVDFDDLIFLTVRLFREYPAVLAYYQQRFRHVLIDEYQDTNHAQYVLVKLLAAAHLNLFAVGDPDQSIYGWRGADIGNILSFTRDYPKAKVIVLEENYRSTGYILEAANSVIVHNPGRVEKRLLATAGPGEPVVVYTANDEREEAGFIADCILALAEKEGRPYGHFAVLYRTNAQSRVIEETFVRAGIPYTVVGGLKFYERKEIKDVLAYLKVIANPFDTLSLARIANVPRRGIGEATVQRVLLFAREKGVSPLEALLRAGEIPGLSNRARSSCAELGRLFYELSVEAVCREVTWLIGELLRRSGYRAALEAEKTVEALGRLENLDEFISVAAEFDRQARDGGPGGLWSFLESVALVSDADEYEESTGQVALMTLHSAKGLEFPVVFITGMEEGIFPHSLSFEEPGGLEEERRLCYVGITRAKERLYLTNCLWRTLYGSLRSNPPSRFLLEIPPHLLTLARGGEKQGAEDPALAGECPLSLAQGDVVRHARFGEGVVVGVRGAGSEAEVQVSFPGRGVKVLMAKYAPLEKISH